MFKKGAFTFILAALIIVGLTATSFANPGKGNSGWKKDFKGNGKQVQFNDIGSHWAAQTIREMNKLGITSGYPDFSFKPNAPVSRYEALMMICRADGFDPVEGQSWEDRLEDCLEYAEENDIIDDTGDFEGWKPAKRFEVAVWAMKAAGDDLEDEILPFLDINDIPENARPYIGVMFNHKWMVGYPDKKFQPNKPVTRAELTVIIYRMLSDQWPDNDGYNDQSKLEKVLLEEYGDLDGIEIEDINLKGNEDRVAVQIKVALKDDEDIDEWEALDENVIEDWLEDLIGYIQDKDEFSEDTVVTGKIINTDGNDLLVKFSKDGKEALEAVFDGEIDSDLEVLEEELNKDYKELGDLKIYNIIISGDEDEVYVKINVNLKDDEDVDVWDVLEANEEDDGVIENLLKSIVEDIQDEFSENTVVDGVIIDIYGDDDDLVEFNKDGEENLVFDFLD